MVFSDPHQTQEIYNNSKLKSCLKKYAFLIVIMQWEN